ncbi:MAG: hypothetical protein U0640_16135 [Phycisphaerales bacterium]
MNITCRAAWAISVALAATSASFAQCNFPQTLTVTGSYFVNGVSRPVLRMREGTTYTFVANNTSLHPLILTTSATGGFGSTPLSAAQAPGYSGTPAPGGQSFIITPGPNTPSTFYYQCSVHSLLGNEIRVVRAPSFLEHPVSETACAGTDVMFHVAAFLNGANTLTYQWMKNSQPLAGETDHMLMLSGVDVSDQGGYYCVVTNECGDVRNSDIATLTVTQCCDSIDFNNDTSLFDPQDIDAFLSVYSEGPCIPQVATCNDIDFNNDTSIFDPCDISSFLLSFSEGPCSACGQ